MNIAERGWPIFPARVPPTPEQIARTLHGMLFASVSQWQDELCEWDDLSEEARARFLAAATAVCELMGEK